jgi:hypothetical protein
MDGLLASGLCVSRQALPDELLGPLCAAVGAAARRLKVVDVREGKPPELTVELDGRRETWRVPDLESLVAAVNRRLSGDAQARAVAVLGEQEGFLGLWAVLKSELAALWARPFFRPQNAAQLRKLSGGKRR